ncbi:MAG: acyl-ACP--UDP-N-acetylglucosamine O-acyltransferase [Candidatus Scalindua sp. AMX11]|nr:MAG: acyl-ACP--UDP-N-acetylglucosamine O-acyltransferase [Candidatus Scalindua sp.]NOG85280.1 acyl-ACP--UDP-N-acetylglucosamine O-acyltransferase [Planctomycetota bacterium]RZV81501.1 MAG: acyl-ACP--UDP-N-acetylglucosamine O-acyltransferase [Candidatus Scalindua sp. SCAELEC01]TDE65426.1 MAG: acyl-ACP--UDP-N-acetylglucosamine O-acyltransferase [Candidatus Scalindua sp. AMX11]GJQ59348.1 MAG: acyl-[acyl-carrier-protein]--UDP-N-acetylglucosamine O-acyltransferase [Candidatus Scalindua sp.]
MKIHPTAIIHPEAKIGNDVEIGPFSVIGEKVEIADGNVIKNSVTITGYTAIGDQNVFHPYTVIGSEPQDFKYHGEQTKLTIGNKNIFRECITVNTGTVKGGGETIIGDNNFFMACSHIAHDCIIKDHVLLANGVLLGGHVKVEKFSKLMGYAAIQPFVTIGQYSYVGGLTRIVQDVPPYMIVEGNPAKVRQVNIVGLERAGFSQELICAIKDAFRQLFRSEILDRNKILAELENQRRLLPEIKVLIEFFKDIDKGKSGRHRESLRPLEAEMRKS